MLSLATFHLTHLCNQLNQAALPISMPRLKSIIFYLNSTKIKLFFQKNAKFRGWGLRLQTPMPWETGGFVPNPPHPHCEFPATHLAAINQFQPLQASGPDGLYPVGNCCKKVRFN